MSGTLAVVSQSGNSLSFFDVASGERTGHLTDLISEPHELILDSKRNLLYLSHSYRHGHFWKHGDCGHEISVIDPVSREVTDIITIAPCLGPHGLAIDTKRDLLWCSYEEDEAGAQGGLVAIDLSSRKVIKRIESTAKTHWFALAANGTKAYTCNKTEEFISVLDLEKGRMTGKISSPSTEECDVSRDGKLVYFPTPGTQIGKNPDTPQVLVIDTSTDAITTKIPLEHGASSLHVSEDGKLMVGQYHFGSGDPASPMVRDGCLSVYDQSQAAGCRRRWKASTDCEVI